jgi:NADPH:quinone reductase
VTEGYLHKIANGEISLGPVHVYGLDDIRQAHTDLEHNRVVGKLVVRISGPNSEHLHYGLDVKN